MTNNKARAKRSVYFYINVLFVLFFFLGGCFLLFAANGITAILLLPFLAANFFLVILFRKNRKDGTFRAPLIIVRIITILFAVIIFAAPILGVSFKNNKLFYPVKRAIFGYGIRSDIEWKKILPKHLPDNCDEYFFRTEMSFPAQDYHPYAYLIFRTDDQQIKEYIIEAENKGLEHIKNEKTFSEHIFENKTDIELYEQDIDYHVTVNSDYLSIPRHVFIWLSDEQKLELSTEAVVFVNGSYGCAFDESSGLCLFWS
ncbi:hypothetical protein [Ruminococcus flavefaciens]|uniref:hypothetical protein n=1 Tax=Ruminococcus flavefaciens TaxID=1265 RepID=UPI00048F9CDC|nr:hypothetical protein [Ruminococcus flavefaciens]